MSTEPSKSPPPRSEGLTGSLRGMIYSLLQVLQTRAEILATEIAEERLNLTRLVVVALGVLFCLQAGLLLGVLFFVLVVGNENRLMAIGIASLALLAAALSGTLWLRWWLKHRPPIFATTMAELRKDRDRLRGES
jgi:uncharacterized membrane protein YqjE